jgi:flagellar biosynthesis/type III secretory pathway protein FliH
MHSFSLAIPSKITRVSLVKTSQVRTKDASGDSKEAYQKGFDSGYQAGLWQAQLEAEKQRNQLRSQVEHVLSNLNNLHEELKGIAVQNLPQLLLASLSRVMNHHRFTDEELGKEVEELIREVSQSSSIVIECSNEDHEALKNRVEILGASLTQGQIIWKTNPSLQNGEYVLQSDLGVVDGRRVARLAKVRMAVENLIGH